VMLAGRYPGRYCSGTVLGGDILLEVVVVRYSWEYIVCIRE